VQPLLWDTCTAIWISEEAKISEASLAMIDAAHTEDVPSYVSPITAWEVGLLVSLGRMRSPASPQRWFALLLDLPGVRLADMSPDTLIAASFLPGKPPNDPADRIIAATARELGATLITRDRALLDYGEQGHVRVVEC
jgi:PIN domain nuclease of toxin-antitoxin system